MTEQKLLDASVGVINRYNRFRLPKLWGSGQRAAADGTKWDVYEQNLLSEYHIRYGGWGGIGSYHVSDTYIALCSSFIACGVWEAIHILDGLLENRSEMRPDTLHADTQGQSETVFGLAYLLAIQLPLRDLARLDDLRHIQDMPWGRQPAGRKDMCHTRRDTGDVVVQAGRERAVETDRFRRVEQVPGRGRAVAVRGHQPRGA